MARFFGPSLCACAPLRLNVSFQPPFPMSKTACDIKDYKSPKDATYICKKCGLKADKEKQLCKPKKR